MNINKVWIVGVIVSSVALAMILLQHWGMTFTNSDDPWIVQLGYNSGIVQGSIDVAKTQGRFWLVPINILAQLPWIPDSWAFVNIIRILVNGLVVISFVMFSSRLTNKFTGILMGLVWLALIDINSSDFSPIHGFLLMFNLQFIFLFLSFYLFLGQMEKKNAGRVIITPYLLYAFAILAYEPMLFYSLVFPALYLYKMVLPGKSEINRSMFEHARIFLGQNIALVVVVMLYLLLYFGYRELFATGTRGVDSAGSLYQILKTIFDFSIHGFHIQIKPIAATVMEQNSTTGILLAFAFASLIGFGLFFVIPRIEGDLLPSLMYRKMTMLVLIFFIFAPNILFGFVEGYREWAQHDPHYVGNYFSSFPLAMLIALLVLNLVGGSKARHEMALFILVLYVFANSAMDNYMRWGQLADENRQGSEKWQAALDKVRQYKFGSQQLILVCAGKTPNHVSGNDKYWSQYMSRKFSANIQFISKKITFGKCDVVLDFQKL